MLLLLFFLVSAGPSPKPAFTDNRVPDAELISSVEAKVVIPAGAEPLTSYDRAYTQAKVDGKDYILGQMIETNGVRNRSCTAPLLPCLHRQRGQVA